MTITNAAAALAYAERYSWAVHPVDTDKKPTTKHGRNDATKDPQLIARYFKNGAQIGVATGPESGLFVLDVDLDETKGINGYETLKYLEDKHGKLPRTPLQQTGRGGAQYLFRYVDGLKNSTSKIGAGIDTRGKGGYIVVAPSRNTHGPYVWIVSPRDTPLADPPAWLIEALAEAEQAQPADAGPSSDARPYCTKMLGQAIARVATAPDGQKHDVLLKMATWMGGFVPALSETEIEAALYSAIVLQADDEQNARKTIQDGIAYGKARPLHAPTPALPQAAQHVDRSTGEIHDRPDYIPATTRPNLISALELRRKQFPNLVWTVDGLIPEGLCLLAAKPKSRKSWLALGIAVAVASGGKAFGYYDVTPGRVLYLDLESNQRRMKSRLQSIISEREAWPSNFDIATDWPRGPEGIALLDGYCEANPDTRVIVIDIWARFRAAKDPKADPYDQDYNALQELNAWAEGRHVTVIVIHHTRKAKSEDPFEEISGTNGILGAVATALKLSTSPDIPDEQLLHMTGRDLIVDEPIALKWDNYTCTHQYVATGTEASSSAERRKILSVMDEDENYQLKEIARLAGKSVQAISNHIRRLMDDRLIQRTGYGTYARVITNQRESRESHESTVSTVSDESSDQDITRPTLISDQGRESSNESFHPLPESADANFHDFHADSQNIVDRLKKVKIEVIDFADLPPDDITGTVREPTPDDIVIAHATSGEWKGDWIVAVRHTGRILAGAENKEKAIKLAYQYKDR